MRLSGHRKGLPEPLTPTTRSHNLIDRVKEIGTMIQELTPTANGRIATVDRVQKFICVHHNGESYVAWAKDAEDAERECAERSQYGTPGRVRAYPAWCKGGGRIAMSITVINDDVVGARPPRCSRCDAPITGQGNIGGRCHNTKACRRRQDEKNSRDLSIEASR